VPVSVTRLESTLPSGSRQTKWKNLSCM
jgi:hypothetical protein